MSNLGFADMGQVDIHGVYKSSFGDAPHGTVYAGWEGKTFTRNLRKTEKHVADTVTKAYTSTIGTTPTNAGQVLVPVWVDEDIVDLTRIDTPLVNLIPRVTNRGLTADWNQITAIASGVFLAEDAALPDQDDTFVRQFTPIKFGYAIGRVTGQLQAGARGYIDAMALAVRNKTLAIKRLEENTLINGDATANPLEYDGLIVEITANGQVINQGGLAITLDDVQQIITDAYNNGGLPNLLVTDANTLQAIKALVLEQFRFVDDLDVAWGLKTTAFASHIGVIPIIPSRFMPQVSGSRALLALDLSVIEMRVLQDVTMELLAKVNDSQKFFLKVYEALIIKASPFNGIITNIL